MVAQTIPVSPFDLVIFGATGDLSRRKILPALFRRFIAGQIPAASRIVGGSRSALSDADFQTLAAKALTEFVPAAEFNKDQLDAFCALLTYRPLDLRAHGGWADLAIHLEDGANEVRSFYMSISPTLIEPCTRQLKEHNLITPQTRVVVEKPLGTDLPSAKILNETLTSVFDEDQIYRIDHYLGKETVQNLMALRFANVMLEPLWNNNYIDHVQITVAETGDVDGRGEYYDTSGAMRDMVQNHLMQLLCLIAMEPPAHFNADDIRNEKLKVIRSLLPVNIEDTVRGQYAGPQAGSTYKDHVKDPSSRTDSYVALKAEISNWRWAGVPFYLRTGKALSTKMSEIVVVFKHLSHSIFPDLGQDYQNKIVIRLQPEEGITMHIGVKEPGPGGMRLMNAPMDMSFAQMDGNWENIDAYERLIMDAIRGNQTLFMRGDEVEAAWGWIDDIIAQWNTSTEAPVTYRTGTSGPEEAVILLAKDGRRWQNLVAG